MSAVYILALKGVRAAVPHLVPAMAADLGFDLAAQGMLLASFMPLCGHSVARTQRETLLKESHAAYS